MSRQSATDRRRVLTKALDSDRWCCRIVYRDQSGIMTRRVVSPIRWRSDELLQVFCLCQEEGRQLRLDGILSAELISSADVLMPEPLEVVSPTVWLSDDETTAGEPVGE